MPGMGADVRDRIKEAMREKEGLRSAADLARACHLAESTARSYLNGSRRPPLNVCEKKLEPGLGVSGHWLFYGKGPRARSAERHANATASELIFSAVEEAFLESGTDPLTARGIAGVIQLIVDAHPRAPPGMSQQEAVRRLVRIHLADILPLKDAR